VAAKPVDPLALFPLNRIQMQLFMPMGFDEKIPHWGDSKINNLALCMHRIKRPKRRNPRATISKSVGNPQDIAQNQLP
jgi:hypothetical protein